MQGIEFEYERIAPAMGISYGGRIALLPGQSKAEEFSCLVHELSHELIHESERRTVTTKTVRETEDEAIAFVISKAMGLETGTASADYIQLYHGYATLLAESLEVVQKTSAVHSGSTGAEAGVRGSNRRMKWQSPASPSQSMGERPALSALPIYRLSFEEGLIVQTETHRESEPRSAQPPLSLPMGLSGSSAITLLFHRSHR